MRARIKATGEILEILDIGVSGKYFYLSNDKKYSRNELEFLSETIDWQHYRIQAAIAAMQGMLSSKETMMSITAKTKERNISVPKALAILAVVDADALIAELKEGGTE